MSDPLSPTPQPVSTATDPRDVPITAAELLVRCLEAEGVRRVFGVPGEETEDLLFALQASTIEFVPTRHEQGAAFIANVWGRLTGEAGVCLSTLGPGATNLLTGVADANLDHAPLVAITAQGSLERLHHESHQMLDVVGIFDSVTKWNVSISSPDIVAEVVRKAFKIAEEEKPGAVQLELPEDVAAAKVPQASQPLEVRPIRRPAPDPDALGLALELLASAERPLILAGNGAIRKLASHELTLLAEGFGIPVAHTFMGKGALSDRSEQSLLAVGLGFRDYVLEAFDRADLILAVGYDIAEVAPESWNTEGECRIVHLDFTSAEIYTHYQPLAQVVGDLSASLRALYEGLERVGAEFEAAWYSPIRRRILSDLESYELAEGERFHVPGVLNVLRRALDDHDLLISDVGSHKMWIARNYPTYCRNGCVISNGLASMGIALPGAIAAALENPERKVVAAMGDGGFLMNSQELETAHRLGVSFVAIVFTDDDYGLISWKQERSRGRSVGTEIGNPDFKAYAESFGLKGYRPTTLAELEVQLKEALAADGVSVIEIPIVTHVNERLIEELEAYWGKAE